MGMKNDFDHEKGKKNLVNLSEDGYLAMQKPKKEVKITLACRSLHSRVASTNRIGNFL